MRVMAVPETGADSDQQLRCRPTTTKGSWEGSAVISLGVTASFLIKDMIGHDRVRNCIISSCIEFYMIWCKFTSGNALITIPASQSHVRVLPPCD